MNSKMKTSLLALSISSVLAACGGGGGGSSTGVPTAVTSSGTIDGFGSVIVNGVRYETTSASLRRDDGSVIDDNPSDSDLQAIVGQGNIVKVRGTSNGTTGTANTITIDDELVGAVSNIDNGNLTFEVKGQTISVTPSTIIDDSIIGGTAVDTAFGSINPLQSLTQLVSGLTVEVSGFPTASGLEATRIEDVATSTTANTSNALDDEIKGFIENLDNPTLGEFQINGLTIDYSGINPAPILADGDLVEVHGNIVGTLLTASSIEIEDLDDLIDDDFDSGEVEIEGIISAIDPTAGTITINSVEIPVDDVTQFSVGMHIEIKAIFVNDTLQVTRIQDEAEDTVRIEVMADAAPVGGVITNLLGLDITPTDRTHLDDDTDTLGDNPSITDFLNLIDSNTHIEARGFPLNGSILWTEIEISNDFEARCRLRGPAADFSEANATITIEGVVVDASNSQFEGTNDLPITSAAFFQALTDNPNTVVQATSEDATGCNNLSLTAKEVSLEPADDVLVGGDDNGNDINDNELTGPVSNVDGQADTFEINGETVTVEGSTLIDDSIVEDARGVELNAPDFLFSDLPEALDELLVNGTTYQVVVDRSSGSPVAVSIEDL